MMQTGRSCPSLIVAAEAYPLAKTGGLADAVGGLAQALRREGLPVHVLLPAYRGVLERVTAERHWVLGSLPGGPARLVEARCRTSGLPCLLLDNPALFDRGGIYVDEDGRDYPDNAVRYAALAHAAAAIAAGLPDLPVPGIVHAHDWHAGLVPMLVRHVAPATSTVLTIHNLSFQGSFPPDALPLLDLPAGTAASALFAWDRLNFLKAGIVHAHCVTTVSRNYAREIITPEGGCGLHDVLRSRAEDFVALPNGIDTSVWSPSRDAYLADLPYDVDTPERKAYWKSRVQSDFGLDIDKEAFLVISCSRLTEQKMADVTLQAMPQALETLPRLQLAVLGKGEARFENGFAALARQFPGRCATHIGYDERAAHRLQAAADALWHPSRFEPFGLTPLYAMRYGALPIATAVGGMVDTIHDPGLGAGRAALKAANGVLLDGAGAGAMIAALHRVMELRDHQTVWRTMQRNAMREDHGWPSAVQAYLQLFAGMRGHAVVGPHRMRTRSERPVVRAGRTRVSVAPGL